MLEIQHSTDSTGMTQSTSYITYRNIGANTRNGKTKTRLWIEGSDLNDCGWFNGDRYHLTYHGGDIGMIRLCRATDGKRKIAGKPGRPIIDICTDKVGATLGCTAGQRVKISITQNIITIKKA